MTEQVIHEEPLSQEDQERQKWGEQLEELMFAGGKLEVDTDKLLAHRLRYYPEGHVDRERVKKWYERDIPWIQEFTGKVPSSWIGTENIERTFQIATRMNAQLSPMLIDAALSHPDTVHDRVEEIAEGQKLSVTQLVKAFLRLSGPIGDQPRIYHRQMHLGMSRDEFIQARETAYEQQFGQK